MHRVKEHKLRAEFTVMSAVRGVVARTRVGHSDLFAWKNVSMRNLLLCVTNANGINKDKHIT